MAKPKPTDGPSLETGMLSFARSLQPSEGLFWGTRAADGGHVPIQVREKGVRGQSSEYKTANPGKSNPQVVEAASVPPGCDGVELAFTMWVLPHARRPWACGDAKVGQTYIDLVDRYAEKGGFDVLARLYLWNIANARFAWRNRFLADHMQVAVTFDGRDPLVFDPARLSLEKPAGTDALAAAILSNAPAPVEELIGWIAEGLREARKHLAITWRAAMQEGQEVFPSQEYLREEVGKNAASRVCAKLPRQWSGRTIDQASMHSQKIGAALRHFDVWHGDDGHDAIAVNPYGGVQETGDVLRVEEKRGGKNAAPSFYVLRKDPARLRSQIADAPDAESLPGDVHFFVANLVRGGVFGR